MQRNLQVRHVPEDVHRVLKSRAAAAGMTLSDYLLRELEIIARRPTLDEALARIGSREPARLRTSTARAVRSERELRR